MSRLPSFMVCSSRSTLCISDDGSVFSFGYSCHGAHGHEEFKVFPPKMIGTLTKIKSISVCEQASVCIDNDGNVYTFGFNYHGQLGIGVNSHQMASNYQGGTLDFLRRTKC